MLLEVSDWPEAVIGELRLIEFGGSKPEVKTGISGSRSFGSVVDGSGAREGRIGSPESRAHPRILQSCPAA